MKYTPKKPLDFDLLNIIVDGSKDSKLAIKLLRSNGFRLITFPAIGSTGPERRELFWDR